MDAEMLTNTAMMIVASALALMLGGVVGGLALRAFGALMDAIPPGAWLAILIVALVVIAGVGGFLLGS